MKGEQELFIDEGPSRGDDECCRFAQAIEGRPLKSCWALVDGRAGGNTSVLRYHFIVELGLEVIHCHCP